MSLGECAVIVVVACAVFDKKKWPMLIGHVIKGYQYVQKAHEKCMQFLAKQLVVHQLQDNEKKAQQAEKLYQQSE